MATTAQTTDPELERTTWNLEDLVDGEGREGVERLLDEAQERADAFVRAGATHVFVGPSLRLRGPKRIVQPLVHHDDHLHARFRP